MVVIVYPIPLDTTVDKKETRPSKLCETQIDRLRVYLKNVHP